MADDDVQQMLRQFRRERREKNHPPVQPKDEAIEPTEPKYLGVYHNIPGKNRHITNERWLPRVRFQGRMIHLGYRKTAIEAAQVRDDFIRQNCLVRALNFPATPEEVAQNARIAERKPKRRYVPSNKPKAARKWSAFTFGGQPKGA
jgi:hypothetical protein